jgi:hypothetical protein
MQCALETLSHALSKQVHPRQYLVLEAVLFRSSCHTQLQHYKCSESGLLCCGTHVQVGISRYIMDTVLLISICTDPTKWSYIANVSCNKVILELLLHSICEILSQYYHDLEV